MKQKYKTQWKENLHFTLNRETRRAPRPPDAHTQMTWKDADKVS
jgi:hypothetical protein